MDDAGPATLPPRTVRRARRRRSHAIPDPHFPARTNPAADAAAEGRWLQFGVMRMGPTSVESYPIDYAVSFDPPPADDHDWRRHPSGVWVGIRFPLTSP